MIEFTNPNHGPCQAAQQAELRAVSVSARIAEADTRVQRAKDGLEAVSRFAIGRQFAARDELERADDARIALDPEKAFADLEVDLCRRCAGPVLRDATDADGQLVQIRTCGVFRGQDA